MLTPDPVAKWRSLNKVAGHQPKGTDDYLVQASITGVKICVQQSCRSMIESWYRIGAGGVFFYGPVAQSVEQRIENPRVGGSIPSRPTYYFNQDIK